MKLRKVISIILGIFVVLSVGTLVYKSVNTNKTQLKVNSDDVLQRQIVQRNTTKNIQHSKNSRIYATYFHGRARCYTCTLIEKYIREVLDKNFPKELKKGKLIFQIIDVEEADNNHYVQDYKLYTKSFILSLKSEGREVEWSNCDKIWKLVRNEKAFKKYIKTEVEKYLRML